MNRSAASERAPKAHFLRLFLGLVLAALSVVLTVLVADPVAAAPRLALAYSYDASTPGYDASVLLVDVRTVVRVDAGRDATAVLLRSRSGASEDSVLVPGFVVAAKTGAEVAEDVARSPSFIVKSNGETLIVPKGATGPSPVTSGKGFQFTGGSGGHGLSPRTTDIRIMDPVTGGKYPYPNGYASYSNGSQTVNPFTGADGRALQ